MPEGAALAAFGLEHIFAGLREWCINAGFNASPGPRYASVRPKWGRMMATGTPGTFHRVKKSTNIGAEIMQRLGAVLSSSKPSKTDPGKLTSPGRCPSGLRLPPWQRTVSHTTTMLENHNIANPKRPVETGAPMAAFCVQDQAVLDPETIRAWRFLDSQGCHFVLVNRDKIPIHRRWQLPWEKPSLDQVLRHLAGGGMVGHVPAAVGAVVLDLDESNDGGGAFMDAHPPYWDIPSRRSGGLHLYYNSRGPVREPGLAHGQRCGTAPEPERLRRHLGPPCPGRHAGPPGDVRVFA